MEIQLSTFLIVCPLVFLAGFVDAVGGGGGLISLPAYLLAGVPAHIAIATNKFSSASGTLISTVRYCKNKCVDWGLAVPGILASFAGAQIGARFSVAMDESVLRTVLLIVLPVVALYVLFRKELDPKHTDDIPRGRQYVIITVATLVIGFYDGFYGPGTGTFLLLVYTGLGHMTLMKASGNMKLANLASNISSLVVFLTQGLVLLPLGAAAAVFSIAGHWLGAGLAMKNGSRFVRIIILCVIIILFIKVLSEV